ETAAAPPAQDTTGGAASGRGTVATSGSGGGNVSSNGFVRDRYLHRTEQVRRMPIAVVMVVDQAHVQDVQRAFANSRLRFQNVQVHWQRFRGTFDMNEQSPQLRTEPGARGEEPVRPGARPGGSNVGGVDTIGTPQPGGRPGAPNLPMPPRGAPATLNPAQPQAIPDE